MTREGDYFVPLEVRARIANALPDAIFVSIHFNAADINPNAAGFEIYSLTPRGAPSTHDDLLKANADNTQAGTPVDTHSIELSASHLSFAPWSRRRVRSRDQTRAVRRSSADQSFHRS